MIRFIHIPKTAGTSINQILKQRYNDGFHETFPAGYLFFNNFLNKFNCISGHIPLCYYNIQEEKSKIFTVFRDPFSRVTSYLNHIQNEENHYGNFYIKNGYLNISNLFETPLFKEELCNLQTRMLGVNIPDSIRQSGKFGGNTYLREIDFYYNSKGLDLQDLENAKEAILQTVQPLLFDHLDCIAGHFLEDEFKASRLNVSHIRSAPTNFIYSDEIIDKISGHNELDIELFKFAQELFFIRVSSDIMRRSEIIDLEGGPFKFNGLHQIESYEDGMLRWTDGNASLSLFIPKKIDFVKITIEIWSNNSNYNIFSANISANGTPAIHLKSNGKFSTFEILVESISNSKINKVDINIISGTKRYGNDIRNCGIPIKSIKIREVTPNTDTVKKNRVPYSE